MRALRMTELGPPENLTIETLDDLEPGPGQMLIKTEVASAGFADLLMLAGKYQFKPPLPFVPGREFAGTVAALGRGVSDFAPGDRVVGQVDYGAFAEQITAYPRQCTKVPDDIELEAAVASDVSLQTANFALLERANLRPGEKVLVTGATTGVGLAALQLGKLHSATMIAGIDRPEKRQLVRDYGAEHVVDLASGDLRNDLREDLYDVTDGAGVDIVIDMLGGDVFDAALRALAWRGRMIVVGFASGRIPTIPANYLLLKNIGVIGLHWANYRERTPEWVQQVTMGHFGWFQSGALQPLPVHRFDFDDAAQALTAIGERTAKGRVTLHL